MCRLDSMTTNFALGYVKRIISKDVDYMDNDIRNAIVALKEFINVYNKIAETTVGLKKAER